MFNPYLKPFKTHCKKYLELGFSINLNIFKFEYFILIWTDVASKIINHQSIFHFLLIATYKKPSAHSIQSKTLHTFLNYKKKFSLMLSHITMSLFCRRKKNIGTDKTLSPCTLVKQNWSSYKQFLITNSLSSLLKKYRLHITCGPCKLWPQDPVNNHSKSRVPHDAASWAMMMSTRVETTMATTTALASKMMRMSADPGAGGGTAGKRGAMPVEIVFDDETISISWDVVYINRRLNIFGYFGCD